jgi:hypothetical protein
MYRAPPAPLPACDGARRRERHSSAMLPGAIVRRSTTTVSVSGVEAFGAICAINGHIASTLPVPAKAKPACTTKSRRVMIAISISATCSCERHKRYRTYGSRRRQLAATSRR